MEHGPRSYRSGLDPVEGFDLVHDLSRVSPSRHLRGDGPQGVALLHHVGAIGDGPQSVGIGTERGRDGTREDRGEPEGRKEEQEASPNVRSMHDHAMLAERPFDVNPISEHMFAPPLMGC